MDNPRGFYLQTLDKVLQAARTWCGWNPRRDVCLNLPEPGVVIVGELDEFAVLLLGADDTARAFLRYIAQRVPDATIAMVCVAAEFIPAQINRQKLADYLAIAKAQQQAAINERR